jgi:hypothetical protein
LRPRTLRPPHPLPGRFPHRSSTRRSRLQRSYPQHLHLLALPSLVPLLSALLSARPLGAQ